MKCTVPIDKKETGESLHDKLCEAGARLIVEALPAIEKGGLVPEKQKEEEASYVGTIKKSLGLIDWAKDAAYIDRLVRGLNSWPSAYPVSFLSIGTVHFINISPVSSPLSICIIVIPVSFSPFKITH